MLHLPTLQCSSFVPHGGRCQKFIKLGVKNERGRSGIDIIYKNKRKFSCGAVVPHSDAIGPTLPGTDEHNNNHVQSAIGLAVAASMAIQQYCPQEVQTYVTTGVKNYVLTSVKTFLTSLPGKLTMTMIINEYDGRQKNEVFTATDVYLAPRASLNIQHVAVAKDPSDTNIKLSMGVNESYTDTFKGVKFRWCLSSEMINENGAKRERRSFELTFHRRHNNLAVNEYLPFILEVAETIEEEERMLKLYSMDTWHSSSWVSMNLDHPSTFDTLAMDADVKEKVIKDLDRFVERREYYRKVGKAWKRGYLLYGPPGTGKSSLIAAMANYLKFDIYDLELTAVYSNSELQDLLLDVGNPSILVVEDIDCSIEMHDRALNNTNRGRKVTLSGFLNAIDGLWSSYGDERIIVFTTNHKEKLDPALIRPGRMDVHVEMSYCTPCGFRVMASNYLDVTEHKTFERIDYLLGKLNITPAQIGEQLIRETDPDLALGGLVQFLDEMMEKQTQENMEKNKKTDRRSKEKKGEKSV